MNKRDWTTDYLLCQRATPGPWYAKNYSGVVVGPTCEVRYVLPNPDAEFIAAAREAFPYWLQRVQELEKRMQILEAIAQEADLICSIFEIHDYPEIETVPVIKRINKLLSKLKEDKDDYSNMR